MREQHRAEPAASASPTPSSRQGRRDGGRLLNCQFQQMVAHFFRDHSRLVARWPLPFLVVPLLLTAGFAVAFYVHFSRVAGAPSFGSVGDRLTQFLPDGVQSVNDLRTLTQLFPPRDALRDSYDLFGTSFAYVIVEGYIGQFSARFKNLCAVKEGSGFCIQHPVMELLNISNPMGTIQYFLRYPTQKIGNESLDNALVFGSVNLVGTPPEQRILTAGAIRLPYILRVGSTLEEFIMIIAWQQNFLRLMPQLQYRGLNIYYTASISWASEIERNGKMIVPHLPLLCLALMIFSVCSCVSRDWAVSKPWLGLCGLLNAAFAVIATMGTLVSVGYPFLQMVFIMPFLILSVSVDNMFLMLNSWRETDRRASVEDRLAKSMAETAVSIMITALTDGLSFSIGSISPFPAVRTFCTYCALAILFVFLYQMTFFIACIALTGRREAANLHCMACFKVKQIDECHDRSRLYRWFCTGGIRHRRVTTTTTDAVEGDAATPAESDRRSSQTMTRFFATTFADVLSVGVVKAFLVLLYVLYVGFAVYGLLHLPLGLDLRMLVPADSHASRELEAATRHFSAYGGYSFVVTRGFDIHYHEPDTVRSLMYLYRDLTHSDHTAEGDFWLKEYLSFTDRRQSTNESAFLDQLHRFLLERRYVRFKNDINFSFDDSTYGRIESSKMLVRMRNVGLRNSTGIARWLRATFARYNLTGFIYEPNFVLVDQQESTVKNVIQNVCIAVVVMMLISLLFIPKLTTALWIGASILSINTGVAGGLALWGARLDIVTMITMVMSIGFSVDFAAHITYHYLVSRSDRRLHRALRYVGSPMLQSAASTVVGVLTLAPIDSYMVRTFVKTVILVVCLGLLHGLVFLPVFLSIFVPEDHYLDSLNLYGTRIGTYFGRNVPKYLKKRIGNARMRCYFSGTLSKNDNAQGSTATSGRADQIRQTNDQIAPEEEIIQRRPRFGRKSRRYRSFSAVDLYDFLKYRTAQQQISSISSRSDEIYSEPELPRETAPRNTHLRHSFIMSSEISSDSSAKDTDSDTLPESASQSATTNSELPLLNSLALQRATTTRMDPDTFHYRASERPTRPSANEWAHSRSSIRPGVRSGALPTPPRRPDLPPPPIPPKIRPSRSGDGARSPARKAPSYSPPPPPPPPRSSSRRYTAAPPPAIAAPPPTLPSPPQRTAPTTTSSPTTSGDTVPIVVQRSNGGGGESGGEHKTSAVNRDVCRSIAAEAMTTRLTQSQDSLIADSDIFGVTQAAGPDGRRKNVTTARKTDLSTFKRRNKPAQHSVRSTSNTVRTYQL